MFRTHWNRLFIVLFCLLAARSTQAQTSQPFDGYRITAPRWCLFNPYASRPIETCLTSDEIDQRSATKLVFPEGILGTPDHELGWVVITNTTSQLEQFAVEVIIDGRPEPVRVISQAFGKTRVPVELHGRPEFAGRVTFSTVVYCEGECSARLVLRPASDPFSREIILQPDAIPRVVVTR